MGPMSADDSDADSASDDGQALVQVVDTTITEAAPLMEISATDAEYCARGEDIDLDT